LVRGLQCGDDFLVALGIELQELAVRGEDAVAARGALESAVARMGVGVGSYRPRMPGAPGPYREAKQEPVSSSIPPIENQVEHPPVSGIRELFDGARPRGRSLRERR